MLCSHVLLLLLRNFRTDKCVLATSGFQADGDYLVKMMRTRLVMYKHQTGDDMSTEAIAHMLSTILYGRRFFPLYTFNIIGGMDSEGKSVCSRAVSWLLRSALINYSRHRHPLTISLVLSS